MAFGVKFWGVRGTIACPGPHHLVYGGNTSCIELSLGDETVVLDAGTGIRQFGNLLPQARRATILLSHTHWDHINGFPFFRPAFDPGASFRIMAGHLSGGLSIESVFAGQMAHPFFPVPIDAMKATLVFQDFHAGDRFALDPKIKVRTAKLNHPDVATAYRVEFGGKSLCYVTDTEHVPGRPDQNVLGLIEGCDLFVYDCTYTDEEFPDRVGWGHSTWQEAVRLAKAAKVKRLAIFHHDPDHEDPAMARIEADAREVLPASFAARDGMALEL